MTDLNKAIALIVKAQQESRYGLLDAAVKIIEAHTCPVPVEEPAKKTRKTRAKE